MVNKNANLTRSQIQRSIEQGGVSVNGQPQKSKYKLAKGDKVDFKIFSEEIDLDDIPAQDIKLDIIYEDENVIVINKQAGLASHPTSQQRTDTLVNALLGYNRAISKAIYDPENPKSRVRAGIVHRLDKNTTGIMIVAKTAQALRSLSLQIKHRDVEKKYLALCYGWPSQRSGKIKSYLGRDAVNRKVFNEVGESAGKEAISLFKVKSYLKDIKGTALSLVEYRILTGRTHQIRVQAKITGNPVIGDPQYNNPASSQASRSLGAKRQMLHSYSLKITLPGEDSPREFKADPPADFKELLKRLEPIR